MSNGCQTSPISRNSTHELVDRGHQGEKTEPAENTEKLGITIMVSEISIFTLAVENCDQWNTAVHQPSAKYYQLLGLHGRRWRKWRKIGI